VWYYGDWNCGCDEGRDKTLLRSPRLQEGFSSNRVDEWDVEIETEITPIEDLTDQEGNVVSGLLRINVRAVWWEDGDYESIDASTWRNPQLYAN